MDIAMNFVFDLENGGERDASMSGTASKNPLIDHERVGDS
jgi:hypothetical protein